MRQLRRIFVLALLVLLGLTAGGVATASATTPSRPVLVGIRAAHHPGYDRIVFDFSGSFAPVPSAAYVRTLIEDASGRTLPIAGQAILQVTFRMADAHVDGHATAPARVAFALPNIITAVQNGDFEGITSYGIGLAKRQPFHVFTLTHPSRVVVDVNAAFRTVQKKVYFFDGKRFAANREPFDVPVARPVLPLTPATGVMDRLFAGPTSAERARGLQFLASGATGYSHLSISGGIARVRLTGGCSSGGSTETIAGEIFPTLRQFSTVRYVKIYDPSGRTERPTGPSDSIPECLEP